MKAAMLFMFVFMSCIGMHAQDSTLVTIKTGNRIIDVISTKNILLYPNYKSGLVYFRDGTKASAMMNYNSLFDQMLFIAPTGDTLALKDEKIIRLISLDSDTFYYNEGYLRIVESRRPVKLAEKRIWEVADIRKIGSHNRPAATYAVTSYRSLTDQTGKTQDLLLDEDILLRKKSYYYFGDTYNHFEPASKKSLPLFFSKPEHLLTNYLKENKVDFQNSNDLIKLLQFLSQKDSPASKK